MIKIMNTLPFTKASNKRKYLGINCTKEVNVLYNENFRSLKQEIKA